MGFSMCIRGILCRTRTSDYVPDVARYNSKAAALNHFLQTTCEPHKGFIYWYHDSQLAGHPESTIDPADGVHLLQNGQTLYYRSVRGALLAGVKTYLARFSKYKQAFLGTPLSELVAAKH